MTLQFREPVERTKTVGKTNVFFWEKCNKINCFNQNYNYFGVHPDILELYLPWKSHDFIKYTRSIVFAIIIRVQRDR